MTYPFVFKRRSKSAMPLAVAEHFKKPEGFEAFDSAQQNSNFATGNPDDYDVAAIIDWLGPYDSKENAARAAEKLKLSKGFYLVFGKRKSFSKKHKELGASKWGRHLQYVGISGDTDNVDVASRLRDPDHKIQNVSDRNVEIWLGEFAQLDAVPNKKQHSTDFDQCEWALIHFLNPLLNEQKKSAPPEKPVFLLNRWLEGPPADEIVAGQDFASTRPKGDWWPDIIEYRENETASLCWLGDRPRVEKRAYSNGEVSKAEWRPARSALGFATAAVLLMAGSFGVNEFFDRSTAVDNGDPNPVVVAEGGPLVLDENDELNPVEGSSDELTLELQAQLQEFRIENGNLLTNLTDKEIEIEWLKSEAQKLRESVEVSRAGGLDKKPCWGNAAERRIDYIYRVTASSNGFMVQPAFPNSLQQAYEDLEPENLVFDEPLSIYEFRQAMSPIYQRSVENDCRHFVLLYEGEQNDLSAYKAQRDAVESYFYIFRPKQG